MAYNAETYRKWYERNKAKRQAYKKTLLDSRRERNWRFKMWESARMSEETKLELERLTFTNSIKELEHPVFIFELYGKKQKESLTDPLPRW